MVSRSGHSAGAGDRRVDPESGELLWRHAHPTQNGLAVSTPVWADGNLLFVSSAYNGGHACSS